MKQNKCDAFMQTAFDVVSFLSQSHNRHSPLSLPRLVTQWVCRQRFSRGLLEFQDLKQAPQGTARSHGLGLWKKTEVKGKAPSQKVDSTKQEP